MHVHGAALYWKLHQIRAAEWPLYLALTILQVFMECLVTGRLQISFPSV